ncbi:MAG: hypothetical protein GC185_08845 [Alphaproteobacteria bacterium]|nr:hypothetical protein [Alphaproteobacteria bacterium]
MRGQTDEDAGRAIELTAYMQRTAQKLTAKAKAEAAAGVIIRPLSPEEKHIVTELGKFNAVQALVQQAFLQGGKVTPETLTRAYGDLQDVLLKDRRAHPENDALDCARMTKLQESYIVAVQKLDYEAMNAKFGVDIVKKEPALKSFAAPDRPAMSGAGNPLQTPGPG